MLTTEMTDGVRIDDETDKMLTILKEKLYSPKSQIIKRLATEELKRVRQLEKQKMEVIAK